MYQGTIVASLNDRQTEAVLDDSDALMIVAGAGSGKTRTLTHKIAYLIEEKGINPWEIVAITFTNKAAGEMRDRLDSMLPNGVGKYVWASTFHSMCVRILRKFHAELGLSADFTIYDTDDSLQIIKRAVKDFEIDDTRDASNKPRSLRTQISNLKNALIDVSEHALIADESSDAHADILHKVYQRYEERKSEHRALDFDDLIMKTVHLFENHPEALQYYHKKLKYVLVDEYQDTNHAQYRLVSLLVNAKPNPLKLVVVGDSDQSIYAFRGATIRNIEEFTEDFPGAKKIILDQNYRSTNNILNAANIVISENERSSDKKLWSDLGEGDKIQGYKAADSYDEGEFVAKEIHKITESGGDYKDIAVFFRTNSASRAVEEKLIQKRIPYKLVGGTKFYDRAEIKDLMAYLRLLLNPHDDASLMRIINKPKRSIGSTTTERLQNYARSRNISLFSAIYEASQIANINDGTKLKLRKFAELISGLTTYLDSNPEPKLSEIVEKVIDETGYLVSLLASKDPQDEVRVENVQELVNAATTFTPVEEINIDNIPDDFTLEDILSETDDIEIPQNPPGRAGLTKYTEHVALMSDQDNVTEDRDEVLLMTLHTAKGLEFDYVFFTNFDDSSLPHKMSQDNEDGIAEERRLAYVGITRAKKKLYISYPQRKMTNGIWDDAICSRFLAKVPDELIEWSEGDRSAIGGVYGQGGGYYRSFGGRSGVANKTTFGTGRSRGYSKAAPKLDIDPFGIDESFDPFEGEATVNSGSSSTASASTTHPAEAAPKVDAPSEGGFSFLRGRRKY